MQGHDITIKIVRIVSKDANKSNIFSSIGEKIVKYTAKNCKDGKFNTV